MHPLNLIRSRLLGPEECARTALGLERAPRFAGAGAGAGFGSSPSPWTPAALGAKLRGLWLGSGASGTPADTWAGAWGTALPLAATLATRPTIVTVDGKLGVDFDAVDDRMARTTGAVTGAAAHTLIVCAKIEAASSPLINGIMAIGDGGAGFASSAIAIAQSGANTVACYGGENTVTPVGATALTAGAKYVITKRYTGTHIIGRVNGAADVAPTAAAINVTGTGIILNHYKWNPGGITPAGVTIMGAAYCDALTDDEVAAFERWMGAEYGVTFA